MSRPGAQRLLPACLGAAVATFGARRLLAVVTTPVAGSVTRTNHRGDDVSLLEGPAAAVGVLAGAAVAGRASVPVVVATAGGAVFGLVDDLTEDVAARRKGLRGHLGALVRGELTTGGLKVLGIGATSLVAGALLHRRDGTRPAGRALDVVTTGALVAGTANLVNLLDLRPGRALKVVALAAVPLLGAGRSTGRGGAHAAAALLGAVAASAPGDLGERDMLGDTGANALGAGLGVAAATVASRRARWVMLGAVAGLTLVSERVSFTQVIARTPVLRRIDEWGRRPSAATRPDDASSGRLGDVATASPVR